ncbi:MAG: hypothetical protein MR012_09265 [Roseburia sp.]|nr:hypothetical protein [Roseburia sp.]
MVVVLTNKISHGGREKMSYFTNEKKNFFEQSNPIEKMQGYSHSDGKEKRMVKPFVIKKDTEPIRPFTIGKDTKLISPFTVGKESRLVSPFAIEKGIELVEAYTDNKVKENAVIHPFTIASDIEKLVSSEMALSKASVEVSDSDKECGKAAQNTAMDESKGNCGKKDATKEKRMKVEEELAFEPVANYILTPIQKIIYINRCGEEVHENEEILVRVEINGQCPENIIVKTSDIYRIAAIIGRRFSSATVDCFEPKAEKIVEAEFRRKTQRIPIVRCYFEAGWQDVDGVWVYLYDGLQLGCRGLTKTNLSLLVHSYTPTQIAEIVQRALHIYKQKEIVATLFLFSFTGVLYRIFELAGFTPHFLLFLNGKSGSMKTTIAKILYTQLVEPKHREHVRRVDADTVVSFERAIVKRGVDTITLIDDYAPAKTAQKKAELQQKLESIIRMIGDGSTKSRSNANLDDIQGEGVRGTVVLTGEIRGKGLSSNLRCLYCEMRRENADVEIVTWFQENPEAFNSVIAMFTNYLSLNWDACIGYIQRQLPVLRQIISKKISERRLIDSAVVLWLVADFVEDFLINFCGSEREQTHMQFEELKQCMLLNVQYSQMLTDEDTPGVMFVKALKNLIELKELRICEKENFVFAGNMDGFEDSGDFYLVPERVFEKVMQHFSIVKEYFPLDLRETVVALHEEGFIKTYANGRGKRTYYARVSLDKGNKTKFLRISRKVLEQFGED